MSLRRIVVVSKDAQIQQLARRVAQEIFAAYDLNEALDIIETVNPDLVLLDCWFDPPHIREFLSKTHKNPINVPVVVVGNGENDTDLSTESVQAGAYDYLQSGKMNLKPLILKEMKVIFLPKIMLPPSLWLAAAEHSSRRLR
jgi:response regulator of citrate/malate metabolism